VSGLGRLLDVLGAKQSKHTTHESEAESASLRLLGGASCALALLLRVSVVAISIATL
jgi:hypothetical protein